MAQCRMEQNQQHSSKEVDPSQESTGWLVNTAPTNLFSKRLVSRSNIDFSQELEIELVEAAAALKELTEGSKIMCA
ncbi:hypothetical protein AWY89_10550 [Pasteurella multocida subsp. multocida]|nr:hypothetical protein AWY89_10550 [Pasteurella multocida subsp. multocida]